MRPAIVVLDGYTLNPGDLSWRAFEELGDLRVYDRTPPSEVVRRAHGAAALLTNKTVLTAQALAQLPEVRYVGVLATGYNVVDLAAARQRGIVVTNVPGYSTDFVAQHVFALLLELTNAVGAHDRAVHEGQWARCRDFTFMLGRLVELAGKTLGIVGLGAIGQRVAQIGNSFGMKVIAAQRTTGNGPGPQEAGPHVPRLPMDELFMAADVLTLHCPLTEQTRHLVSEQRLALMRPTAFLINTGRGGLVDEAALAAALRAGRLAGAAVDVLSTEPPPPDNPLLSAPRCIITPHIAWRSMEARQRLMDQAAANLQNFLAGRPVNVIS